MNNRIRRNADGQFASGQSGNPAGARLRRPKRLLTITDLHRLQLEVAGEIVGMLNGKPITRFENALRSMAKGDPANRLAMKDFVEGTQRAAYSLAAAARREAGGRPPS
jgi:hypothetical protein